MNYLLSVHIKLLSIGILLFHLSEETTAFLNQIHVQIQHGHGHDIQKIIQPDNPYSFLSSSFSHPRRSIHIHPHPNQYLLIVTSTSGNANENEFGDEDNNYFSNDELEEESRKRFEQITKDFLKNDDSDFPSMLPRNPFSPQVTAKDSVGNSNLYSDDELMSILSLHNELSDELKGDNNSQITSDEDEDKGTSFSLHDLVMRTVGTEQESATTTTNTAMNAQSNTKSELSNNSISYDLDELMTKKVKQIRAIASDIDGTILTKRLTIHPRTKVAVRKAIKCATDDDDNKAVALKYFFPATGKSRKGAIDSLSTASMELGMLIENSCPGVYLQGLYCVDGSGDVIFEQKLDLDAIDAAEELVEQTGVSIVAYDGDNLYTTEQTDIVISLHEVYGEPLPILLPSHGDDCDENDNNTVDKTNNEQVRKLSSHNPSMHKLLIMDDDIEKLTKIVRPQLEELAIKYNACVTQAIPNMLELLPIGCSKASGVEKLCDALSINMQEELMSIGDAENDAGMLEISCIGVAVGNACPIAKKAADIVLDESNEEGGAGIAIEISWKMLNVETTIHIDTRLQMHDCGNGAVATAPASLRPFKLFAKIFAEKEMIYDFLLKQNRKKNNELIYRALEGINDPK